MLCVGLTAATLEGAQGLFPSPTAAAQRRCSDGLNRKHKKAAVLGGWKRFSEMRKGRVRGFFEGEWVAVHLLSVNPVATRQGLGICLPGRYFFLVEIDGQELSMGTGCGGDR